MSLPIIPWLGGKRRLADKLLPLFPEHECYVEVFCGGAALFFMRSQPAACEVINDINGELVNLYRVVQHHLPEFVSTLRWALSSRQQFGWNQQAVPETLTDIQRAARFYHLQQHAFGSKLNGQTFGTMTTGRPINLCRIEENLSEAHLRLGGVLVENQSWQDCVRRYDRPHTFFYMDPPYWQMEGYAVEFPFENYVQLAEAMRSMKGKAMLSINDHPDIREAFSGLVFHELDISYSVGNNHGPAKTSRELVIMNYEQAAGLF